MLRAGHAIQLVVVALLGLAVVMVNSAGMIVGPGHHTSLFSILWSRHGLYALASVAAMLLTSRLDLRQHLARRGWSNPVPWLLLTALVMVGLTWVPGIGVGINGAHRWLRLGPASLGVTFQPSELVKWSIVLAIGLWCARRGASMREFRRGLLPPLVLLGFSCLLIVKEDLGTAALVGMVAMILLVAGGARLWHLALVIPPAAGAIVVAIASSAYRRARLTSFLDPYADALGSGYQAIQSMLAIAQGGITGRGLGNGIQKFDYLPTDTSDCLFAVICEELGLGGAAVVVGLYMILLWIGLRLVKESTDTFSRLVTLGIIMTVGLQALINIAVVTVVVPTKGIALPLLSAGGTGWIVTAAALGLVAGLDRHAHSPLLDSTDAAPANSRTPEASDAAPESDPTANAIAQA